MKLYFDYKKYKAYYTADFETSTAKWNVKKARVWLWDICTQSYIHYNGNSLQSFIEFISRFDKCVFAFHNLSYDGSYLLSYLIENGYQFVNETNLRPMEFTTIITPQNQHYVYQIRFRNGNTVTISDSLKHNSQSVDILAKTYNLPINKLSIDYDEVREEGHEPTELELAYIHHDTEIVMRVLNEDFKHKFTKFTESGNSRMFFKKTHFENYDELFPQLSDFEDNFVRRSYRGGFCWLNPLHFNEELGGMISIDINSMYPAQMLHELLPYGQGQYLVGNLSENPLYNPINTVFIQHLKCEFKLKPNHPPIIPKKSVGKFAITDLYLSSSDNTLCDLYLTSVDLELFFECYYVWNITYIDGMLYKAIKGYEVSEEEAKKLPLDEIIKLDGKGSLYYDYLYDWRMQKEHETGGKRDRAKKMQNIAYGSQASSKKGDLVYPYLNEKNLLRYKRYGGTPRKGGYIPVSTFITAWSRKCIVTSIINNFDRFVYCDTDSCYLIGHDLPNVKIHDSLYGYFKVEHKISKAKYLGPKRYCYYTTDDSPKDPEEFIVVCCGAPKSVVKQMTFENFVPYDGKQGIFKGKIKANIVEGGKHLEETTYKLIIR